VPVTVRFAVIVGDMVRVRMISARVCAKLTSKFAEPSLSPAMINSLNNDKVYGQFVSSKCSINAISVLTTSI